MAAIGAPGFPAGIWSMRLLALVLLTLGLAVSGDISPVCAQAAGDIQVANARNEHPDYGVLMFNISINKDRKMDCIPLHAVLKPEQGRTQLVDLNTLPLEFTAHHFKGALAPLPPGTWTVVQVSCYKHDFNGPIVQVKIAPGEIVNAGHVVVDRVMVDPGNFFTRGPKFSTHVRIEELPAESVASLKTRAPETFARAKRRNFAINTALN